MTQLRKHTGIKNIRYVEEFFQKTETIEEPEITVDVGDQPAGEEPVAEAEKPEAAGEEKPDVAEELPPEDYDAEPKSGDEDAGSDAAVAEPEVE